MRVLVMRDSADALRTASSLTRLGHEPIVAPVIAVAPRPSQVPRGRFDGIVATSRHAFLNQPDVKPFGERLPVFAVGRRTAEAARAVGFKDVRIAAGDGADLATLIGLTLPRPARLLYLAGRDRKPTIEAALETAGITVDVLETYEAVPVADWPPDVIRRLGQGEIDAALHYSRRAAELSLAVTACFGVGDAFLQLHHACLSGDVAAPLTAARAFAVAVAAEPDEERLLALLSDLPRRACA